MTRSLSIGSESYPCGGAVTPVQMLLVQMYPNTPNRKITIDSIDHEEVDKLRQYSGIP